MLAISADASNDALRPDAAPFLWLLHELDGGRDGALLTAAAVHGGAPRPVGTRMAVGVGARFARYLSGGCVEPAQGNKLTHPYLGRPLISHLLDVIDQLDVGQRIIVTSERYRDDIMPLIAARPRWRECVNLRAANGIGSSIVAGAAMLDGTRGVFICPGDMPQITPEDFFRTAALFKGPTSMCRPLFKNRPGHPVLFGSAHFQRLRGLGGDRGGASVLNDDLPQLATYASTNQGVVLDCDTAEHFAPKPSPIGTPPHSDMAAADLGHASPDTQVATSPGEI